MRKSVNLGVCLQRVEAGRATQLGGPFQDHNIRAQCSQHGCQGQKGPGIHSTNLMQGLGGGH